MCDRGERSEGGGNGESTAIAGVACNNRASKDSTRAGGLKAQTSPSPCEGGTGSVEGPGPATDLPFPTAFKTLLGSAMALWASSAPDVETVKNLGLDTAINGFLAFISPSPPTAVSPIPLPVEIPSTPHFSNPLLPSPLSHDNEDAIMASRDSLDMTSYYCTPMPHPLEKGKI